MDDLMIIYIKKTIAKDLDINNNIKKQLWECQLSINNHIQPPIESWKEKEKITPVLFVRAWMRAR